MRSRLPTIIALLSLLCVAVAGQTKEPGGFAGQVTWKGSPFPPREVLWAPGSRGIDVVLERLLLDHKVMDETLVVDPESRGIRDVAIFLPDFRLPGKSADSVELTIANLAIRPRVAALSARSKLVIHNRDPLAHELVMRDALGVEQRFQFAPGARQEIELPKGDRLEFHGVRFSFMAATVHRVGDIPAIITGKDGRFRVNGLEGAEIKIDFEHPLLGRGSRVIEVKPGALVELELHQDDFETRGQQDYGTPFSTPEDIRYRIEGLALPRVDFERVVAFLAARHHRYGLPRSLLENHALRQVLIPLAATFAHFRAEIPRLDALAGTFQTALENGESFAEASRRQSEAAEGNRFGPLSRQDVDPWLGAHLFSAPRKIAIGPLWSTRGLHFFLVDEVQGEGSDEKRAGFQAFFSWDATLSASERIRLVQALADRARVEVVENRRREPSDDAKPR